MLTAQIKLGRLRKRYLEQRECDLVECLIVINSNGVESCCAGARAVVLNLPLNIGVIRFLYQPLSNHHLLEELLLSLPSSRRFRQLGWINSV